MSDDRTRRRAVSSIAVFLILTAVLSAVFYPIAIRRFHEGRDESFIMLALMWCPGVAGLATRLLFQGNLRGHGLRWGRTRDQVVSYLIPLAYAIPVYVPVWIAGAFVLGAPVVDSFVQHHPGTGPWMAAAATVALSGTIGFLVSCLMTTGEELGWRGFLVPQMAAFLPFRSVALLSGAIWAAWHVPLIVFAGYRGAGPLWYSLTCFFVMVIAISLLLTWVRLKTGSIWPAVVLHGSHNQFIQGVFDAHTRATGFTVLWTGEFGAGLALAALGIGWIVMRRNAIADEVLPGPIQSVTLSK